MHKHRSLGDGHDRHQFIFYVKGLPEGQIGSLFVSIEQYEALHSLGFFCSAAPMIGSLALKSIEIDVIPDQLREHFSAEEFMASNNPEYCTVSAGSPFKVNLPAPSRRTVDVADITSMSVRSVEIEGLAKWKRREIENWDDGYG